MSESEISISGTTASSSFSEDEEDEPVLKQGPGVDEPLVLVRMSRGVQADHLEAPCVPLVFYEEEAIQQHGTCPICLRPFARWNEEGGYKCYACKGMVTCNRRDCLKIGYSLSKRKGPCPLCRAEDSLVWVAGKGMKFGGLTHPWTWSPAIRRRTSSSTSSLASKRGQEPGYRACPHPYSTFALELREALRPYE